MGKVIHVEEAKTTMFVVHYITYDSGFIKVRSTPL